MSIETLSKFAFAVLASLCFSIPSTAACAETTKTPAGDCQPNCVHFDCVIRPQDSIWLFSTRHLGCPGGYCADEPAYQILRCDRPGNWHAATLAEFLASGNSDTTTIAFIHGNRIDWSSAIDLGLSVYYAMAAGHNDDTPIRYVIWSWPSDKLAGPRRDIKAKALRTNIEGLFLADLLTRMEENDNVALVGFSFGARIITGALHYAAGGALFGWRLPPDVIAVTPRPRAVLMAPALHNGWLLPGSFHDQAIHRADEILIQHNPCDSVLKWYPIMDLHQRPQALGFTGLPFAESLGDDAFRVRQQNVAWYVGSEHDTRVYLGSLEVMREIWACVFCR